jgi:Domain of unknown function (DUF3883)
LRGLTGVQLLDSRIICKEVVVPKIISTATPPEPDTLLSLTRICKEILGAGFGGGELWVITKSGKIISSKEVFFPSEFKAPKNWERYQAHVPGLSFIDTAYLPSAPTDDDLRTWREFFKAAGVKENPDNGVEDFAVNFALEQLRSKYTNVALVEKRNFGFDISAETTEGTPIQVEVKGLSADQDVELTGNETNAADKYQDSFYLCVVTSIPNLPTIHFVQNPARIGTKNKLTIPVNVWKAA